MWQKVGVREPGGMELALCLAAGWGPRMGRRGRGRASQGGRALDGLAL